MAVSLDNDGRIWTAVENLIQWVGMISQESLNLSVTQATYDGTCYSILSGHLFQTMQAGTPECNRF